MTGKLATRAALWLLATIAAVCLLAPWLAPYDPSAQNLLLGAQPPSLQHWLGTDSFGRDLLSRLLHGGRLSMLIGLCATAVALLLGISWGATAGFVGGRTDAVMMRIVDAFYALPFVMFVVLLMVVFGRSLALLFIAIGAVEWLTMARIVRAQVRALKQSEFVEAARCIGLSNRQILWRHVLPNCSGPIIVYTTLTIPSVMLLEAFLSFLGLGVQPPQSSWGALISQGVETMEEYPWLLLYPAAALTTTLLCLNLLGDQLRDWLENSSPGGAA